MPPRKQTLVDPTCLRRRELSTPGPCGRTDEVADACETALRSPVSLSHGERAAGRPCQAQRSNRRLTVVKHEAWAVRQARQSSVSPAEPDLDLRADEHAVDDDERVARFDRL